MKKIILLFALILSVGSLSAKEDKVACNVTFPENLSTNCTYNTSTNIFAWTASTSNSMKIFKDIMGKIELSTYKYLNVNPKNLSGSYRIIIYCDNNGSTSSFVGTYSEAIKLDLTSITLTTTGHTYTNINNINIAGSGDSGNLTITEDDVYLSTGVDYENMGITTSITNFEWYNYSTNAVYGHSTSELKKQLNTNVTGNNQILYGTYNGNATTAYMDVTGYDNAIFTLNTAGACGIRLMYNETTVTIDTDNSTTSYTQSVTSIPKIATIKTKNGSADNKFNVASIIFQKDYKPTSTTAFNISASLGSSVAYDRTFTVNQKSTVCLPFALTAEEVTAAGKFYKLTSVVGGVLHFTEQSTTEAYVPYVFVPTATNPFASLTGKAIVATPTAESGYATPVDGYTFQGTMKHQTLPSGVFGYNSSTGAFSKTTSTAVTIDAFRGYITAPTTGLAISFLDCTFDAENVTGITEMKGEEAQQDKKYYNLKGQVVENPTKGLYIVNGKKIVIK